MPSVCPNCKSAVFPDETVCPYCGNMLSQGEVEDPGATLVAGAPVAVAESPLAPAAKAGQLGTRGGTKVRARGASGASAVTAAGAGAPAGNRQTRAIAASKNMPRPSATERINAVPQASYLTLLLGVIGILVGLTAYAIYAMNSGSIDQKKLEQYKDPLDKPTPVTDKTALKYICVNIRLHGGTIDMIVETQGQLPGPECEQVRTHIGTMLLKQSTAMTLVDTFTQSRKYKEWRELGGTVNLTIRSSPKDMNGYWRQNFRIE